MRRKLWWGDFAAPDFMGLDPDRTIAVLPLAAIEQHGPHLPVSTDLSIMRGMLETVFPLLPEELDVRFLPVQAVGKSNEHVYASGTLSLSPLAAIQSWADLCVSVSRAGIRKIVLVNSHGGNEEVMGIVAREARVALSMLAVKTSWQRFGRPAGLFSPLEEAQGIHGGDVETSLMLHFEPHLVDMAKADNFVSRTAWCEENFDLLRPQGPHAFAWIARDLNPAGVVGEAAGATAEKGRLTAAHQAEGFVRLLRDVTRARLADLIS